VHKQNRKGRPGRWSEQTKAGPPANSGLVRDTDMQVYIKEQATALADSRMLLW